MLPLELMNIKKYYYCSHVATEKGRISTSAYQKAIAELPKDQDSTFDSIINFNKKAGESTK